jgi:hypothetical protein
MSNAGFSALCRELAEFEQSCPENTSQDAAFQPFCADDLGLGRRNFHRGADTAGIEIENTQRLPNSVL